MKAIAWLFPLLLAGSLGGDERPRPQKAPAVSIEQIEQEIYSLLNRDRTLHGMRPLLPDSDLAAIARDHSSRMAQANQLSHTFAGELKPSHRLVSAGRWFAACSENVASSNYPDADLIEKALMESLMHRINILDPQLTHCGIGVALAQNTFWVSQEFAAFLTPEPVTEVGAHLTLELARLYHERYGKSLDSFPEAVDTAGHISHQMLVGGGMFKYLGMMAWKDWGPARIVNFIHFDPAVILKRLDEESRLPNLQSLNLGVFWGRSIQYPGGAYSVTMITFSREENELARRR